MINKKLNSSTADRTLNTSTSLSAGYASQQKLNSSNAVGLIKIYRLFIIFILIIFLAACSSSPDKNETGLILPDDLEATLWAESPMLHNPTNMDVDSRGRIWITEAVNYRNYNNDSTKFLHYPAG